MTQKRVTESDAVGGTLDKAGDIRHNKGITLTHVYNSEDRSYGCKMIIPNDWLGFAYNGNQG